MPWSNDWNRLLQHTGNLLKLHRKSFTLLTATPTTDSSSGDWHLHPFLSFSPSPNFVNSLSLFGHVSNQGSDDVEVGDDTLLTSYFFFLAPHLSSLPLYRRQMHTPLLSIARVKFIYILGRCRCIVLQSKQEEHIPTRYVAYRGNKDQIFH